MRSGGHDGSNRDHYFQGVTGRLTCRPLRETEAARQRRFQPPRLPGAPADERGEAPGR